MCYVIYSPAGNLGYFLCYFHEHIVARDSGYQHAIYGHGKAPYPARGILSFHLDADRQLVNPLICRAGIYRTVLSLFLLVSLVICAVSGWWSAGPSSAPGRYCPLNAGTLVDRSPVSAILRPLLRPVSRLNDRFSSESFNIIDGCFAMMVKIYVFRKLIESMAIKCFFWIINELCKMHITHFALF